MTERAPAKNSIIMNRLSPTFYLVVLFSLTMLAGACGAAVATVMTLSPAEQPRLLGGPILGGSTSAFFEHLLDHPAKIAALGKMAIGLDRFPGGSDANFYCDG